MQEYARTPAAPLVSLVLVTYNSAAELPAFFSALEQIVAPLFEVIVVDNASHDDTVALARRCWPTALIQPNTVNIGFGRACNQGAALARGAYIQFLNADVVLTPTALQIAIANLQAHPDIGILCPSTLYPDQTLPPNLPPLEDTAAVPGCAMIVPQPVWEQLGGFDERIFLYWEDTELCWRAWLLGWRVVADLRAVVYHERGASTGFRRWDEELTKNSLYTYLKLMRWPLVLAWLGRTLLSSAVKTLMGRWVVWRGWWWNLRHSVSIWRARRQLARQCTGDRRYLEQLIKIHARRTAAERRARAALP